MRSCEGNDVIQSTHRMPPLRVREFHKDVRNHFYPLCRNYKHAQHLRSHSSLCLFTPTQKPRRSRLMRSCVFMQVCVCVCSAAGHSHQFPFTFSMSSSLHPTVHPLPFRCLSCLPETQKRGLVALTSPSDPQETLIITAPPSCLTVQPVMPAQTEIASETHPHILCLLAVTHALTTVPVIVL